MPDLRPVCSRSANAACPARRRVIVLTAPRVYRASARGKVIGCLAPSERNKPSIPRGAAREAEAMGLSGPDLRPLPHPDVVAAQTRAAPT